MPKPAPRPGRRTRRRGATAVEFALAAPLLLLFFFAALEFGRMNMVRHTMQNAAYEAARHGLAPNVSDTQIEHSAYKILKTASVRKAHIQITHDASELTVTVSAPFREQGWIAPFYLKNTVLASAMTLSRDIDD